MSEPPSAAFSLGQLVDFLKLCFHELRKNQLRHTVTTLYGERDVAEVEQDNADLTTVICVDRPGCVQHSDTMLKRKTAPWSHLSLIPLGDGNGNTGGNKLPLSRLDHSIIVYGRIQINACRMLGLVVRDLKAF